MGSEVLGWSILSLDREPWERQRGESRQAYAAWEAYRDMEAPRSYRRVAQDLHKSATLIGGWGKKWRWQARFEAYSLYLEKVRVAERIHAIIEMNERYASTSRLCQERVSGALNATQFCELTPSTLVKLLDVSIRIERTALGLDGQSGPCIDPYGRPPTERQNSPNILSEQFAALKAGDPDRLRRLVSELLRELKQEAKPEIEGAKKLA
jgi:hypothetical protein